MLNRAKATHMPWDRKIVRRVDEHHVERLVSHRCRSQIGGGQRDVTTSNIGRELDRSTAAQVEGWFTLSEAGVTETGSFEFEPVYNLGPDNRTDYWTTALMEDQR